MPSPDTRTITLELASVVCRKDNGFVIIKGIIRGSDKPEAIGKKLTCLGRMPEVVIGAYYKLTGTAKKNEKFNEYQLHFTEYEIDQTASATGLVNYLAKECPHIGTGRADQIVKEFGEQAFAVLMTQPELVAEKVVGVNLATAKDIQKWAIDDRELSTVKHKLYQAGLTTGLIKKLLEAHGSNIESVLQQEAFTLTEIKGIGFLTADRLAIQFGMPSNNPTRIKAGVLYALREVMDDKGHVCVDFVTLINAAIALLGVHKDHIISAIKQMVADKELCTQHHNPAEYSKYPELFQKESKDVV